MEGSDTFFFYDGSTVVGPHSGKEIAEMHEAGTLKPESQICTANDQSWKSLKEFPELLKTVSEHKPPKLIQAPTLTLEGETQIYSGSPSLAPAYVAGALGMLVFFSGYCPLVFLFDNITLRIVLISAGLALIGIPLGLQILRIKTTKYLISNSRIKITTGILNRRIEEIELHRVQDTSLVQKFVYRLMGLGSIYIVSVDRTDPIFIVGSIEDSENIREKIRSSVLCRRKEEGVKEVQMF